MIGRRTLDRAHGRRVWTRFSWARRISRKMYSYASSRGAPEADIVRWSLGTHLLADVVRSILKPPNLRGFSFLIDRARFFCYSQGVPILRTVYN